MSLGDELGGANSATFQIPIWPTLGAALFAVGLGFIVFKYFGIELKRCFALVAYTFVATGIAQAVIENVVFSKSLPFDPMGRIALLGIVGLVSAVLSHVPLYNSRLTLPHVFLILLFSSVLGATLIVVSAWLWDLLDFRGVAGSHLQRWIFYAVWQGTFAAVTLVGLYASITHRLKKRSKEIEDRIERFEGLQVQA